MATQPQVLTPVQVAQNEILVVFGEAPVTLGVGPTEPVVEPLVEPEVPVVPEQRLNKQEIKEEFRATALPADASPEDAAAFEKDKKDFTSILTGGGDNEAALWEKLKAVRERVRTIAAAVVQRKAEKVELEREFTALDFAVIDPAPTAEKDPVKALGPEIRALLDPADSYNRVGEIGEKLKQAKQQVAALRDAIEKRAKAKAEILQQLTGLAWTAIAAAPDDEKAPLNTLKEEAERKLVDPLTKEGVEGALSTAGDLARKVDELALEVEKRQVRKNDMEESARAITLPPEAEPNSLDGARKTLSDELKKPLSEAVLAEAEKALASLQAEADVVREKTDKLIAKREMFRKQLTGAVKLISTYVTDQKVTEKVDAAKALLDGLPIRNLDQFPAALKAVRSAAHTAISQKGTAGAPYINAELAAIKSETAVLASGLSSKQKTALETAASDIKKSMGKSMTKQKAATNLKAVRALRVELEEARAEVGEALEQMAEQRDFIQSEIATADPDGVDSSFAVKLEDSRSAIRLLLVDPLEQGKLDNAAKLTKGFHALHAKAAQDVVDGEAVKKQLAEIPSLYDSIRPVSRKPVQAELAKSWTTGQALAAAKGDSRDMKAALSALEKLRARLAEVDTENGKAVASKAELKKAKANGVVVPEADADEIYDAFGPDAIDGLKAGMGDLNAVAALCKSFKSAKPDGVAALGALTRDGLGSAEALVAVLKDGCGGDVDKLKQFETAFGAEEDRANLKGMVETALGKDPALLTSALVTGCGLDTMPITDRKDFPTAAADLKTFCAAFKDEKDQKKLNSLLQNGGISSRPKVFGNVLKIGCEGDPEQGEDSMDYRAGQMKKLAAAYGNPADQARLKGLMDKGGFGHKDNPGVLAHVLKTGCDGDPTKLKNLGNTFKTDEDLGKLDDLLKKGGFGGTPPKGRQDTLGKVLGKGLRYENTPEKDEPQRLKKLHEVFSTNGGADMAKLKTMVDTFNDDKKPIFTTPPPKVEPREDPPGPVPGERFFNLLNKKNMNGNIEKLKTMHNRLDAQSKLAGSEGINPPTPVPKSVISHEDLIRNASTIKKAGLNGDTPALLGQGNCVNIKAAKMAHFCRHTREHTQFDLASKTLVTANLNSADQNTRNLGKRKAKKTTLWPEGITDTQIAEYVDLALTALGTTVPKLGTLNDGDFIQFDRAIASTPAFTVTIGFERKGSNIEITQFFPTGGPGLETIEFYDTHAIKEGIV